MNNFKIVIPVFNSANWIETCIKSVLSQTYKQFELIVINDYSTDNTLEIIKKMNIKYIDNKNREGCLANMVKGFKTISTNSEDILMVVDGDDWLIDNFVFSYLDEIYQDKNIWLTYGQFEPLSHNYHNYCKPLTNTYNYRKECSHGDWKTSQLRTFKKKLWDKIRDKDLRGKDEKYYMAASDWAIMFPMIEMAGLERIKFIDKVLYIYNDLNPIRDMIVNRELQLTIGEEVRDKIEYKKIEE